MFFKQIPRTSAFAVLVALIALTGCGAGTEATSLTGTLAIRGNVHGGQQAVSLSSVNLYAAGTTGNGLAAVPMLINPVTSGDDGYFTLTGDYKCTDVEDQVYLAATGGNPGLEKGTNNKALVMLSALGRCGDLPTTPFVSINELTTVAAAWALAPFISSATNIGATPNNAAGIKNGFLNSALLVDPRLGELPTLPSNLKVETGKITALANSIASCVNSDGGVGCSPLFTAATPSGGTAPTDTLTALLNIVRNPGYNVKAVFNAASTFAPFSTSQKKAPKDWTMSLTVTGGGLNAPTAIAVDMSGNVWVANYAGGVSDFTPQGTPIANADGGGVLNENFGMTIDPFDNVWVANVNQRGQGYPDGSVSKLTGNSSGTPGVLSGNYSDAGMDYPESLAADTNGNILIANYANSTGAIYYNNGNVLATGLGAGSVGLPVAVAADSTHGMWLANQANLTVTHLNMNGAAATQVSCCNEATGIAVDVLGNAWVANFGSSSVSEVSVSGVNPTITTTLTTGTVGGLQSPDYVVIDGAQDVWLTNYYGGSFSHIAGNDGTNVPGTALSPSGLGLDASLLLPFALAVDATGNVWVSNYGNNDVVMFFGLAAPTKTPVNPSPSIP